MEPLRLERLHVMVVDDNRTMLKLMSDILRALGIRSVYTVNGPAEAFREMRINPIDLVFVDWEMSPLTGVEFVRMLRTAKDSANVFAPVIMLTSYTQMANVIEARDAGANEFLAKPVSPKRVYQRILSVIKDPRPFIRTKTYFGPDRRWRQLPFKGPERRKSQIQARAAPSEGALKQDAVDALFG